MRHYNFVLQLSADDGTKQMHEDATFCPQAGLTGEGNSITAWGYPTRYIRHFNNEGYVATNGGPEDFDATRSFTQDVTFLVEGALA